MMNVESERVRIADMAERYGMRVESGPSEREHALPINHIVDTVEVRRAVRQHLQALAGMIRAGFDAEADWPVLS